MARILPLPPETISQIHSSKTISSLQGVVLSLLENSLDAASTKIDVKVDFRRGGCVVEDNGFGILPTEFEDDGGLGKLYHTSKHASSNGHDSYGNTGTYLASLAALSLLNITSHHVEHQEHASLTIHQGRIIARQVPSPAGQEIYLSPSHGTRVTVRDLFGNMPVRVKQRALAADVGFDDDKAWQELRRGAVALLITWKNPCSVRIHDETNGKKSLNLTGIHPTGGSELTEKSMHRLAGKHMEFDLQDTLSILFQAGLAPTETRMKWTLISASTDKMSVQGAVCLVPVPTRQCQFISISIHPCSAASGHNELYDAVNRVFANSNFGHADDFDAEAAEAEKDRRKLDRRYKTEGYTRKQMHSRKGVDRWPMFVFQIQMKDGFMNSSDVDHMSKNSLRRIVEVLEASVTQWLEAKHFRPRKRLHRKHNRAQSPASIPESECSSSAEPPSRSKPGTAVALTPDIKQMSTSESTTTSKKRKHVDVNGNRQMSPLNKSTAANRSSDYFSGWSRIKSGKDNFYDELWQEKKPSTAPAPSCGSKPTSIMDLPKAVFKLPPLEAGELSSTKLSTGKDWINSGQANGASGVEQRLLSSEDFGSVDESQMLAAENVLKDVQDSGSRAPASNDDGRSNLHTEVEDSDDPIIDWVDPVTTQVYKVNARTGVVLPSRLKAAATDTEFAQLVNTPASGRHSAAINTSLTSACRPLSLARRSEPSIRPRSKAWLPGFLKDCSNPVFARQNAEKIPVASLNGPGIEVQQPGSRGCANGAGVQSFRPSGAEGTTALSKAMLKQAKIIRQVDQKFILCTVPGTDTESDSETLVLVDQHAASERVVLEDLFAELCAPTATTGSSRVTTTVLEKSLHFQISAAEMRLFQDRKEHFASWGVVFDVKTRTEEITDSQVRPPSEQNIIVVRSLPPAIAERCTLVPKLLIDLLRSELWSLAETSRNTKREISLMDDESRDDHHQWLRRIGSCPQGIIDMLNSRACRSAIMFNDVLSTAQCDNLLAKLSECAFPFMCAHGRISMVPLVKLGSGEGSRMLPDFSSKDEQLGEGFTETYRRWRATEDIQNIET